MPGRDPLDVIAAIHSTPARRYLKPEPISDDVLWELLDAAIRGPTGGNSQQWGWVVVRDPATKRQIAEWYRPGLEAAYGHDRAGPEELTGGRRIRSQGGTLAVEESDVGIDASNQRAVLHLAEHIGESPVLVFPVLRGATPGGRPQGGSSIYGAVQNLMLAARAHGIGSVFTGGPAISDRSRINELLGLPDDAAVMAMIPLGYPARGRWAQPKRRPVEAVTHWERWGEQRLREGA